MSGVKLINWKKPNAFINKLIMTAQCIAFVISLMAISIFYIWNIHPEFVDSVDNKFTNYFIGKYKSKYKEALKIKNANNTQEAIILLEQLLLKLEPIGKIDKLYNLKRSIFMSLIDIYIKTNEIDKAYILALKWKEIDEKDIDAQLSYVKILRLMPNKEQEVTTYYNNLSDRFINSDKVVNSYITYLIDNNKISKSLQLSNKYLKRSLLLFNRGLYFQIEFQELKSSSQNKNSIEITNYKFNNDMINFNVQKTFNGLSEIKINIKNDFQHPSLMISDIAINISSKDINEQINMSNINVPKGCCAIRSGVFLTKSDNPFITITTPNNIRNYSGELNIKIEFKMGEWNYPIAMADFLTNNEWMMFYKKSKENFTQSKNKQLIFDIHNNDELISEIDLSMVQDHIDIIRFDLPSKINMCFLDIIFKVYYQGNDIDEIYSIANNDKRFTFKNIQRDNNSYIVNKRDPYLYFPLMKSSKINKIIVTIKF